MGSVAGRGERLATAHMDNAIMVAERNSQIERLDTISNWLMAVVIVIPFVISAGALTDLAAENGIRYPLLYPFMVDGGLIIFKALALRHSLHGQRDWYSWSAASGLTIISVVLNVVHVPESSPDLHLAQFMAALPPLVILTAFIAISRRVEESVRLEGAVLTVEQIVQEGKRKQQELDESVQSRTTELSQLNNDIQDSTTQLERLAEQVERLSADMNGLKREKRRLTQQIKKQAVSGKLNDSRSVQIDDLGGGELSRLDREDSILNVQMNDRDSKPTVQVNGLGRVQVLNKEDALKALLAYVTVHPNASLSDIGQAVERSKATISNYVAQLKKSGRLSKNGQGWLVVQPETQ